MEQDILIYKEKSYYKTKRELLEKACLMNKDKVEKIEHIKENKRSAALERLHQSVSKTKTGIVK